MPPNIIHVNGKPYLELPCLPGTTVYTIESCYKLTASEDERGLKQFPLNIKHEFEIVEKTLFSITDVVDHIKDIGNNMFLTIEEAEEYKKRYCLL